MAFITAETRSDIVELAMGMLNQAPSTTLLNTLISKTTDGASLQDLANYIATTDAFVAQYPATQTAREFATEMFDKLITGGTLAADIRVIVIDTLEGLLNAGTTKAEGFVAVIDFLSNSANASHPDLGDISKSFQNRADAAEYYSITKELGGSSDAQLAAAIASVTSDAATLTAANAAADSASGTVIVSTTALTISGTDTLTGTAGNDAFVGATTGTIATYAAGDSITDSSTTDSDSLTLEIKDDTGALAAVRNVETVNVNVNTTTATGSGNADDVSFAATNMQGVKTYNFDVTKAVSAVSQVLLVDAEDGSTVNASADFREVDVEVETAGDDVTINAAAAGTRGTPVVVTLTNTTVPGDVIVTGAGYLTVDSDMATASGLLKVTAGNNLTMDGDGAAIIDATSTSGSVTISDATDAIAVITNSAGNTSIAGTGAGSVNATAGGSVSLTGTILSTSATLNAAGTSVISGTADSIVSAVLSGNGAAATYAFTGSHDALAEIVTTGAQNVTISVIPVDIGGALTITNGNDGATNLTLATTAGAVDLSDGQLLDNVKLSVDNGGSKLTVVSGQNVQIATDQGASQIAVGKAASAATNTLTLNMNDGVKQIVSTANNRTEINTSLTITQAAAVTINADADTNAAGGANPMLLTGLNSTMVSGVYGSAVTINTGVNGITMAGTHTTLGTGSLTITGSGDIALGSSALTSSKFDASAVTGKVTGTGLDLATVPTVLTGAGADTLTLVAGSAASFTVDTGAGNDTLTLPATDWSATGSIIDIDLGEGTDTVVFQAGTKISTTAAGSATLDGAEVLAFAGSAEVQASIVSGKTTAVAATGAGASHTVTVAVAATDTAVNLATLVGSTAVATDVSGMTFVVDASANTAAVTITGANEAKNTITGSSVPGDVLTGGDKSDNFTYSSVDLFRNSSGTVLDTLDAGSGLNAAGTAQNTDTLTIDSASAISLASTVGWASVKNFEKLVLDGTAATVSATLPAAAETAGLSVITAESTSTVSVDASAYTSKVTLTALGATGAATLKGGAGSDSITGSAPADKLYGNGGNDTLVGAAGADTLSGGDGNDTIVPGAAAETDIDVITGGNGDDTIVYYAAAELIAAKAFIDSIDGGAGTSDTISLSDAATSTLTIADDEAWTRVSNVERLVVTGAGTTASPQTISVDLDVTAWAAGIRTVDISAGKGTTNVLKADEITGGGLTLKGSSTEDTTITGGSGDDIVYGGDAADTFTLTAGGAALGADTVMFASSAVLNGSDTLTIDTTDKMDFSAFLGASYTRIGELGAAITPVADSGTADVAIDGKMVVLEVANADAGDFDTAAELFAIIDGSGDALEITAGKSVVVVHDLGTDVAGAAQNDGDMYIFYIDTTADELSGLSVNDITLVGTAANIDGSGASTAAIAAMFVG